MIRSISPLRGIEIPLGGNLDAYDPEVHQNTPLEEQPNGDVTLTRRDGNPVRIPRHAIAFLVEDDR